MLLPDSAGTWIGTNGFRLMPGDPLAELPASVTVSTAAGGHLLSVAYRWEHPADGPQEGLLPAEQATAEISAGPYPVMIMQTRRA
jgi:hypothetical protein